MATFQHRVSPSVRFVYSAFAWFFWAINAALLPAAIAQDSTTADLTGPWVGWLETPAQQLRLLIQIGPVPNPRDSEVADIEGTIVSLDQTPEALPFSRCTLSPDGTLEFSVVPAGNSSLSYSFRGKQYGSRIDGEFQNANAKLPLSFRKADRVPDEGVDRLGASSAWRGELDLLVRKINVRFRVYDRPPYADPESPRVLFDSLSEKVSGFPVRVTSGDKGQVVLSIPSLPGNAKFLVDTTTLGESIRGRFIQSLLPLALELNRVDELKGDLIEGDPLIRLLKNAVAESPSEETTKPTVNSMTDSNAKPTSDSLPDGIREEEFSVERIDYRKSKVKRDGRWVQPKFRISGTITWPAGSSSESKSPAVVMVSGSGPQDRDETIGAHQPFRVIAHWLAKHGVASLRYDDRGTGASTGEFLSSTTFDFADDAAAVWQHARTVEGIDRLRVGLLGHSEGGIIGPMVAANEPEVAFLILLAPPAFAGSEILATQIDRISELQGVDASTRQASIKLQRNLQSLALEPESDEARTMSRARQAVLEQWDTLRGMSEALPGESEDARRQRVVDQILAQFKGLQTPWMRYFLAFDPTSAWLVMRAPTLAIWGDKDVQVIAGPNRERLFDVASRNPRLKGDLVVLPGLNHIMQRADTGLPDEYDRILDTVDSSAFDVIREWMRQQNLMP
jgi:pimeloyl-ACP methyl ester carboxylesterase